MSCSSRKVQGFLGRRKVCVGGLPTQGLLLSPAVFHDPKPREAEQHRAAISMATTRQEMR